MTASAIPCMFCPDDNPRAAVKRFTWVNREGSGVGGGQRGGPMCDDCMEFMWDALSRFPTARETVTLWPLDLPK